LPILDHNARRRGKWTLSTLKSRWESPSRQETPTPPVRADHIGRLVLEQYRRGQQPVEKHRRYCFASDTEQPRYCNFVLNCPPQPRGLFDDAIVKRLAAVGKAWSPDTTRTRMPSAPPRIDRPFTPVSATATSAATIAWVCIDNCNDGPASNHTQTLWTSAGALPQSSRSTWAGCATASTWSCISRDVSAARPEISHRTRFM